LRSYPCHYQRNRCMRAFAGPVQVPGPARAPSRRHLISEKCTPLQQSGRLHRTRIWPHCAAGGRTGAHQTPRTIHRPCHTSHSSRPPFLSSHSGFLLGLLREIIAENGTCAAEAGMPLRRHNVAFVERFVQRFSADLSQLDMPDCFYWHGEASSVYSTDRII